MYVLFFRKREQESEIMSRRRRSYGNEEGGNGISSSLCGSSGLIRGYQRGEGRAERVRLVASTCAEPISANIRRKAAVIFSPGLFSPGLFSPGVFGRIRRLEACNSRGRNHRNKSGRKRTGRVAKTSPKSPTN